uniref:Peroxisomal membrane protein PEX16 n=1 Tax=Anisakis simplex TaxID=6269 RepID=A0A0M3KJI8_ANISI
LAYFLRENSDEGRAAVVNLMGLLVSNRDFVAGLWEYTVGLRAKVAFGTPKTLISVLEKRFIWFFAVFWEFSRRVSEEVRGGDVSPNILAKDLTLGLIDIAYPVVNYGAMSGGGIGFIGGGGAKAMTSEEREKNAKWAELFRNVASITKVLYERDSRLHFMPNGFWSNHNRQVVINTVGIFCIIVIVFIIYYYYLLIFIIVIYYYYVLLL